MLGQFQPIELLCPLWVILALLLLAVTSEYLFWVFQECSFFSSFVPNFAFSFFQSLHISWVLKGCHSPKSEKLIYLVRTHCLWKFTLPLKILLVFNCIFQSLSLLRNSFLEYLSQGCLFCFKLSLNISESQLGKSRSLGPKMKSLD